MPAGAQQAAVTAMQENEFLTMGVMRTILGVLQGDGACGQCDSDRRGSCVLATGFADEKRWSAAAANSCDVSCGYLCLAVNSYLYFFLGPMITEILIALCLGWRLSVRRQTATERR